MKEIVLVCTMGISTAFIVRDMMKTAKRKNIDINIRALAANNIDGVIDFIDLIILTPPIASQLNLFKEKAAKRVPVILIAGEHYITSNGEAILEDALKKLDLYKTN